MFILMESSGVLVRPMMIAPAFLRRLTKGESSLAIKSAKAGSPLEVGCPSTSTLHFTVTGTPCRGPVAFLLSSSRSTFRASSTAVDEARKVDRELESKKATGPLHGVPVTVKCNVDVEGQPTSNGLPAFADLIAREDSPLVSLLKKAGAIIIGRTNTPELSMRMNTDNPLFGRTLNPWDEQASPGGSSGGASSAAAAGFGPIHHGNDIGGSLRYPAHNCGLATVKPTFGRVPAWLSSAPAERGMLSQLMSVQGAICREVEDVRLATRVMSGSDPRDPFWMPVPFDDWPDEPQPIRVGVATENYEHPMHRMFVVFGGNSNSNRLRLIRPIIKRNGHPKWIPRIGSGHHPGSQPNIFHFTANGPLNRHQLGQHAPLRRCRRKPGRNPAECRFDRRQTAVVRRIA